MSNFLRKRKKKVNKKKKSYADRPYLIFLAMLVETKKKNFLRLRGKNNLFSSGSHYSGYV